MLVSVEEHEEESIGGNVHDISMNNAGFQIIPLDQLVKPSYKIHNKN